MAMVGAGIANDGTVMKPYLLNQIVGSDGAILRTSTPEVLSVATTADVAQKVQQSMESVVQGGTGTAAAVSGYKVRGKTGTAETGSERDNSWFVGYIEVKERKVVVAIVFEAVDAGFATPKARDILQAAAQAYAG
jgi:peptidoglycan glycosyltransferase